MSAETKVDCGRCGGRGLVCPDCGGPFHFDVRDTGLGGVCFGTTYGNPCPTCSTRLGGGGDPTAEDERIRSSHVPADVTTPGPPERGVRRGANAGPDTEQQDSTRSSPDTTPEGPGSPDDEAEKMGAMILAARTRDEQVALVEGFVKRLRDAERECDELSELCDEQEEILIDRSGQIEAAEERERRLRSAVESVCDEYGDDGWARTAMVRRLRAALRGEDPEDANHG